jgi:hypothetical protein
VLGDDLLYTILLIVPPVGPMAVQSLTEIHDLSLRRAASADAVCFLFLMSLEDTGVALP